MKIIQLAILSVVGILALSACDKKEESQMPKGEWEGEAYADPNNPSAGKIVGTFSSYEECIAGTKKEAGTSGVFRCGLKK